MSDVLQVSADLLPSAVGVALSPVPIVAVILVLATPRAKATGSAFAVGWVTGLALVTALVTAVSSAGGAGADEPSTPVAAVRSALGVALLLLAAKQWKGRPGPGEDPVRPKWMQNLDELSGRGALLLGGALSGMNPKNLALTVAAATTLADSPLSGASSLAAATIYVVVGSASVAGPVAWFLVAPRQAAGPLDALKEFMETHNPAIMATVLLILGTKLATSGLATLTN